MKKVILKPGREKSALQKHPWIFSGAIQEMPSLEEGEIVPFYTSTGTLLGSAYFHPRNSLAGRVLSWGEKKPLEALERNIGESLKLRSRLLDTSTTTAYRLINAEGDGIPGLIVDKYRDVLVFQANTCGIEKLKPLILERLIHYLSPKAIYEKSTSSARLHEGLPEREGFLYQTHPLEFEILENGLSYFVSLETGQKTGFFLDQREMRKKISQLSYEKKVLNCFSYTGGFSKAALAGGASHVTSVDISQEACRLSRRNTESYPHHTIVQADVFTYLKESSLTYDLVILDPPAFAKKKGDVQAACQGYKEINRRVMEKIPPGSLLLTSSCSAYMEETLFQNLLFQASLEAKRNVQIIGRHIQAPDHPIALTHPEGEYLKSCLLYIQ